MRSQKQEAASRNASLNGSGETANSRTPLRQRHGGTGASTAGERLESNSPAWKHVVPEELTNKMNFKQWGRRDKLVACAKGERFKVLVEWVEARESNAATT